MKFLIKNEKILKVCCNASQPHSENKITSVEKLQLGA